MAMFCRTQAYRGLTTPLFALVDGNDSSAASDSESSDGSDAGGSDEASGSGCSGGAAGASVAWPAKDVESADLFDGALFRPVAL